MSNFIFKIENIQHIDKLTFSMDLSAHGIICIAGKNGCGKTTLIKSIRNLVRADTFQQTSSVKNIINNNSRISYTLDGFSVDFNFDSKLESLEPDSEVPERIKRILFVELPVPYGERFTFFQSLASVDDQIRAKYATGEFSKPDELIEFLNAIYRTDKFKDLLEIETSKGSFYCLNDGARYIREDYLSSGEYFLISLYRKIKQDSRIVVIDEIEISLDPAAQVNLLCHLRLFCEKYNKIVIFTTHSFVVMRLLKNGELYYMERDDDCIVLECRSYNYIASVLYGFTAQDKFLIFEDQMLIDFMNFFVDKVGVPEAYPIKKIEVGGGPNVIRLLRKNKSEFFFTTPENVLGVIDGDLEEVIGEDVRNDLIVLPFDSIEKFLLKLYLEEDGDFSRFIGGSRAFREEGRKPDKKFYRWLTDPHCNNVEIEIDQRVLFDFIFSKMAAEDVNLLKDRLSGFFL